MGAAENKAIVAEAYEAFGRGDLDSVFKTYDDDIVWTVHGVATSPLVGEHRGIEAVREFFTGLDALEITRFDLNALLADGDYVVALLTEGFTVKATGKTHEGPVVHVYEMRGGKVVRAENFDTEHEVW